MNAGEQPSGTNPLAGENAPRLSLVVRPGTKKESRIRCRRVVTLIGSRRGCKVTLRHGRVGSAHVAIINTGSELLAVDLVTSRGTLLNDLKMEHERLSDADMLKVGGWSFKVDIAEPATENRDALHPIELEITPQIIALEHLDTGRILQPNREVCLIGRQSGCDIVISDSGVSRAHALILEYYGHPAIFDLLSSNETFVNDKPVQFHLINNNDIIAVGESRFRVHLVGSPVTTHGSVNRKQAGGTVALTQEQIEQDMVDIHATESTQRWRIAESFQKTARRG